MLKGRHLTGFCFQWILNFGNWRQCNTLHTSTLLDDVMFFHNGQNRNTANSLLHRWCQRQQCSWLFAVTRQVAPLSCAPGGKVCFDWFSCSSLHCTRSGISWRPTCFSTNLVLVWWRLCHRSAPLWLSCKFGTDYNCLDLLANLLIFRCRCAKQSTSRFCDLCKYVLCCLCYINLNVQMCQHNW